MFSKKDLKGFQQKYQELSQKMESMETEGSAGSGLVRVKMNGRMELISITIDPACVDPQDVGVLQDLILSSVQDAQNKIQANMSKMMPSMPGMGGF